VKSLQEGFIIFEIEAFAAPCGWAEAHFLNL